LEVFSPACAGRSWELTDYVELVDATRVFLIIPLGPADEAVGVAVKECCEDWMVGIVFFYEARVDAA